MHRKMMMINKCPKYQLTGHYRINYYVPFSELGSDTADVLPKLLILSS